MPDEQSRAARMAALEAWEAALSAYALEASRYVTGALRAAISGLPCPREPLDDCSLDRLHELRATEQAALESYLRLCGDVALR